MGQYIPEYEYTPEYCKDIKVKYHIINTGEPAEQFYPGCDPEIEIFDIEVSGNVVSEYLFTHLMENHEFEQEIVDLMKRGVKNDNF